MSDTNTSSRTDALLEHPKQRMCGAMQVHNRLLETDPNFRLAQGRLEQAYLQRLRSGVPLRVAKLVRIPVVVHVVYRTAAENLSDAQVRSQIAALNRDYRKKNTDRKKVPTVWKGLVADTGIEFQLATTDPKGRKTTGITRKRTNRSSFGDDDSVKSAGTGGVAPWPTDQYLNLWVCRLAGGLLGYAQFPGGPAATDGVVILNTAFGTTGIVAPPFNQGRTATHEVGHWLNLRHVWGDTEDCSGNDYVVDTPNAQHPNYGQPTFPHISCNNGPHGDMFMNYMDYVDDAAMCMFTVGQVARMHATLAGPRNQIGRV